MRLREAPVFYVKATAPGTTTAVPVDVSRDVLQLEFEDGEGEADKLTLTVDNFDLRNFDDLTWRKGTLLEVAWGYAGHTTPPRQCIVQSVKGFQVLKVEALAKSILMHKKTKSRVFHVQTRAQVIRQIAEENGYGAEVQHVDDTKAVLGTIAQVRETDAAFMKRLALREGYQFFVDHDGLHFHKRKLAQTPVREYVWYTDPGQGDILSFSVENDVTLPPAAVTVKGRDPLKKEDFAATGSNATTARDGLAPQMEEAVSDVTGVITTRVITIPTTERTEEAAKTVADAKFTNAALTTVLAAMKAVGDPDQVAKTVIKVSGIRSLSGNYYVKSVKHTVGATYDMDLKIARDGRAAGGKKSDAKVNTKEETADAEALTPEERVSGVTGTATTVFRDTRGRAGKDSK